MCLVCYCFFWITPRRFLSDFCIMMMFGNTFGLEHPHDSRCEPNDGRGSWTACPLAWYSSYDLPRREEQAFLFFWKRLHVEVVSGRRDGVLGHRAKDPFCAAAVSPAASLRRLCIRFCFTLVVLVHGPAGPDASTWAILWDSTRGALLRVVDVPGVLGER